MMQFQFKSLIYPSPSPQYDKATFPALEFVAAPNERSQPNKTRFIPYLYIKHEIKTNLHFIYFHGNKEDIQNAQIFVQQIQQALAFNAIIVEYPGYGIYKDYETSDELIQEDSLYVFEYVRRKYDLEENDIVVFGRSLGSGPACFLGTQRRCKAIILMSAYTSIQAAAKDKISVLSFFVKDRFPNANRAKNIMCPVLLIHGRDDKLISPSHSEKIFDNLDPQIKNKSKITVRDNMNHSKYSLEQDLIIPIYDFLIKLQ
ncbi:hypothetical protein pb186bvf_015235 [Paramecium bursaria]